jgi:amino acid transporter
MGVMIAAAGTATPLALLSLCAIMLCIAGAFAMLSRVSPNAGSSYSWVREAFGPLAGAYAAWLLILSNFFATMATAVPAGIYTLALVAPAHEQDPRWSAVVGAIWIGGSALLLYLGIRPTARVTLIALLVELGVLVASAIAALVMPPAAAPQTHAVAVPVTLAGFVAAMTLAVWMVDGWELSASTSEEVNDDARASGRGGITGLLVTTAVLGFCMIAYMRLGGIGGFVSNQADALAYVGDRLGGSIWRFAIVTTVLVSCCSALWTTILYLSRSVFAMGRDGVLPRAVGSLDARNEPRWALAAVAVLTMLCELVTGFSPSANEQLTLVLDCSSLFLGLLFAFSALACARRFHVDGTARINGVVIPLVGAVALLAVLGSAVASWEPRLRWYALAGVLLGLPFAAWRGARRASAG